AGLCRPAGVALQPQSAPLRDVFPALHQARRLEDAFESNLTPPAEPLRVAAQRFGEAIRLAADRLAGFDDQLDLLFEGQHFARLGRVGAHDPTLEIPNALTQWIENRRQ